MFRLLVLVIIIAIPFIVTKNNNNKSKKIDFNEFDDLEKLKEKEIKANADAAYETQVLNKVYRDTYNQYRHTTRMDPVDIHKKAEQEALKAANDLKTFKILDNVEVEKEDIKEGNSVKSLREGGNTFDVELFKKWCRQIYGCIKIGNDEQLAIVKNFITDELYNRFQFQKKQFENDGLEFVTEDLMINGCKILDYSKGLYQEDIKILIEAKMIEYIQEKSTGRVVRGDNKKSFTKSNVLTFTKRVSDLPEGLIHNCPNCGAEVSQTELGKCRYCNTLLFPIRYNWTLTKFESV